MRPASASRARHAVIVASAMVVDQYQKPDQITPSRTTMVVGTAISHGRDPGESFCVLTPTPTPQITILHRPVPTVSEARALATAARSSCTFLNPTPTTIFGYSAMDR